MKVLLATTGVVVIGSVAAVLVVPPSDRERLVAQQVEAERLIHRVSVAAWQFHRERGVFPPGDGTGSASLVRALSEPSRAGIPYLRFPPDALTGQGHLRNPVAPDVEILFYRNNRAAGPDLIGGRNFGAFDLWGRDALGWKDGVNNWGRRVPSP